MMKINIEFEVEIPDDIEYHEDQLEEFLRFEFRDNGVLSADNPLKKVRIEPVFGSFLWGYD